MPQVNDHFEEEYIYLADVTHDAALISWGKFFFDQTGKLIKDKNLKKFQGLEDRSTCIGEISHSYGAVNVEILDTDRNIVSQHTNEGRNYRWMTGLRPNTEYTYQVRVQQGDTPRFWGDGPLSEYDDTKPPKLKPTDHLYKCRFRTFPAPDASEPLIFAVIGDPGTASPVQTRVARALEAAIDDFGIRLVLMVGDTIYKKDSGGSGDDDDEWLTTYFQPYRHIISRVPVFPCMGNHDTKEGFFTGIFIREKQGDRVTLYDNLLIRPRFFDQLPEGREASLGKPGLFYRFKFGRDVEFICLDTSKEGTFDKRLFRHPEHKDWVDRVIRNPLGAPRWRIPFTHHPPYCGGPRHGDDEANLEQLLKLCTENGIRTFISGHEHDFQCIDSFDWPLRCFISGGAGKLKDADDHMEKDPKDGNTRGFLHTFGGTDRGHFLVVTISDGVMTVKPMGEERGVPIPLSGPPNDPHGNPIPPGRDLSIRL